MSDTPKPKARKYTADEYERMAKITLSFGMVAGALLSADVVEYFEARGVTRKELDACYKAVVNVSKGFYRDPA